jgi:hypothetical protein
MEILTGLRGVIINGNGESGPTSDLTSENNPDPDTALASSSRLRKKFHCLKSTGNDKKFVSFFSSEKLLYRPTVPVPESDKKILNKF